MDKEIKSITPKSKNRKLLWFSVSGMLVIAVSVVVVLNKNNTKRRPQEPTPPYPYYSEDVMFPNAHSNVTLAGTLTLPSAKGTYPAVILISGSGPQTRDGEFAGHKHFLVLSDYLTRNGIAVLRYDDRGYGKSSGDFASGTSLDFSYDVEGAVKYLKSRKEISHNNIGLIGHSDGAMIAPMVAARSQDVAYIILLAGPGIQGAKLLLDRQELLERRMGISEKDILKSRMHSEKILDIIIHPQHLDSTRSELIRFSREHYKEIPDHAIPPGMSKDHFISMQINLFTSPWFKYFLDYDPANTLQHVKCPVLALNGDLDVQVPAKENLEGIVGALKLGGNSDVTALELPKLNHAFQECTTGMPDEYSKIDQSISPVVLNEINKWIALKIK